MSYQFTGSQELFFVQPNPRTHISYDIHVANNRVSFSFSIYTQDVKEFNKAKTEAYHYAFDNLQRVNSNLQSMNGSFENTVKLVFQNEKDKFKGKMIFFKLLTLTLIKILHLFLQFQRLRKKIFRNLKYLKM